MNDSLAIHQQFLSSSLQPLAHLVGGENCLDLARYEAAVDRALACAGYTGSKLAANPAGTGAQSTESSATARIDGLCPVNFSERRECDLPFQRSAPVHEPSGANLCGSLTDSEDAQ